MALEDAIAKLTAAVEANTAALAKSGGTAAGTPVKESKPAAKTSTKTETTKPKHDRSAVNAALEKVKDDKGVEAAKAIISEVGGVAARKDIPEDKFDAVVAACEKVLEEAGGSDDDL